MTEQTENAAVEVPANPAPGVFSRKQMSEEAREALAIVEADVATREAHFMELQADLSHVLEQMAPLRKQERAIREQIAAFNPELVKSKLRLSSVLQLSKLKDPVAQAAALKAVING